MNYATAWALISWAGSMAHIHKMTYNHPLGSVKALERFFNRGPYAVGGDSDTVNMGATLPSNPEVVITVPSFRQIVDLADLSRSLSIHAPGQSGLPASKHYDDFIPLWMKLEYHPMLFTRQAIEEKCRRNIAHASWEIDVWKLSTSKLYTFLYIS